MTRGYAILWGGAVFYSEGKGGPVFNLDELETPEEGYAMVRGMAEVEAEVRHIRLALDKLEGTV